MTPTAPSVHLPLSLTMSRNGALVWFGYITSSRGITGTHRRHPGSWGGDWRYSALRKRSGLIAKSVC